MLATTPQNQPDAKQAPTHVDKDRLRQIAQEDFGVSAVLTLVRNGEADAREAIEVISDLQTGMRASFKRAVLRILDAFI